MRLLATLTISLLFAATLFGAGIPANSVTGHYVEARTADVYVAACFANAEVGIVGDLAVFGWKVDKGTFDGVRLDGLGVVGVVKASATLGDVHNNAYPVRSVLIVDERATPEQRLALQGFARKMAGDLLQNIVRIDYQPIDLKMEGGVHDARATLKAGNLAAIETRALHGEDKVCSNEVVWYLPLTKLEHAMPAYTVTHSFRGQGLGSVWSNPDKRSAYVGSFHYQD